MKYLLLLTISFKFILISQAQNAEEISLDLLRAPQSPAFTILGLNPTEIEKPSDPSDLIFSLGNATNSFTSLPESYALEFSPAWLIKNNRSVKDFIEKQELPFWQNAIFSVATTTNKNPDSSQYKSMGLGFKTSLFRGKVAPEFEKQRQELQKLVSIYHGKIAPAKTNFEETNSDYIKINTRIIELRDLDSLTGEEEIELKSLTLERRELLKSFDQFYHDTLSSDVLDKMKKIVSELDFKRYGWKVDFAMALKLDFPSESFTYSLVPKWSWWLTSGYESKSGFSILTLVRYNEYPQKLMLDENDEITFKTVGDLDFGIRLLLEKFNKLTLSTEAIKRLPIAQSDDQITQRYDINMTYELTENKLLTFTFGKDFEGVEYRDGNLLAILNLALGFGNKRPIVNID